MYDSTYLHCLSVLLIRAYARQSAARLLLRLQLLGQIRAHTHLLDGMQLRFQKVGMTLFVGDHALKQVFRSGVTRFGQQRCTA